MPRPGVTTGQRVPAPLEIVSLVGDASGREGSVVLRGDPAGCALLRNGIERRMYGVHAPLRPESVDAQRQEVAA